MVRGAADVASPRGGTLAARCGASRGRGTGLRARWARGRRGASGRRGRRVVWRRSTSTGTTRTTVSTAWWSSERTERPSTDITTSDQGGVNQGMNHCVKLLHALARRALKLLPSCSKNVPCTYPEHFLSNWTHISNYFLLPK